MSLRYLSISPNNLLHSKSEIQMLLRQLYYDSYKNTDQGTQSLLCLYGVGERRRQHLHQAGPVHLDDELLAPRWFFMA